MEERRPQRDPQPAALAVEDARTVRASGTWTLVHLADLERRLPAIPRPGGAETVLEAEAIESMDSAGAWLLLRTAKTLERDGTRVEIRGLRPEFAALADMISARGAGEEPSRPRPLPGWLERIGRGTWNGLGDGVGALSFVGENTVVLLRSLARPGRIRWKALLSAL